MKRRALLATLGPLTAMTLLGIAGCASPQIVVDTPLGSALGESVLSVQVTSKKSFLGPLSPNGRYAERIRVRLKNRLIQSGFVLMEKTADLHLHVFVEQVTTGGGNNEAECRLKVTGYREWPGDFEEMQKKSRPTTAPIVLELSVQVVKKRLSQGYNRELLAEEAAKDAAEVLVDYLKKSK